MLVLEHEEFAIVTKSCEMKINDDAPLPDEILLALLSAGHTVTAQLVEIETDARYEFELAGPELAAIGLAILDFAYAVMETNSWIIEGGERPMIAVVMPLPDYLEVKRVIHNLIVKLANELRNKIGPDVADHLVKGLHFFKESPPDFPSPN